MWATKRVHSSVPLLSKIPLAAAAACVDSTAVATAHPPPPIQHSSPTSAPLRAEMQNFSSILRLLRRPDVATSSAPMHRLSSLSRPLHSFMPSPPPRWWPPALARRVFPPSEPPNLTVHRVSRFPLGFRNMSSTTEVKRDDSGKPDMLLLINFTVTPDMNNMETRSTTGEPIACYGEVIDGKHDTWGETAGCEEEEYGNCDALMARYPLDRVRPLAVIPKSRHRDGSIYKCTDSWTEECPIADRNETVFEAMMFTESSNCFIFNGTCMRHGPTHMLQIISIKMTKIALDGPIVLYGYIALRDNLDPLLNYVVKFSRDDPIIVEQGSLINLAGPKRGINYLGDILIEYDMRIKTVGPEEHDLQLIDGVSILGNWGVLDRRVFTRCIHGDCGAVDISFSSLENAIEATVEVAISELQSSFNLSLGCFTSGLNEQIRLFDGVIGEAQSLKRSVLAVVIDSWIHLKFRVGTERSSCAERDCFFNAGNHGSSARKIKTDFALISVKVIWSPLPDGI